MSNTDTENQWLKVLADNPEHSANYAQRWERFRAEGRDLDGEARLIDAMAARGAKILDVGAGTGRTGGYLATQGHRVTGIDIDEYLVTVARKEHPEAAWLVGDIERPDAVAQISRALTEQNESSSGQNESTSTFDIAVSAGQVLGFLSPAGRRPALKNIYQLLADDGRAVVGYGCDRGYAFEEFFADATAVGFAQIQKFSTWALHPFQVENSGFLVAILTK